MKSFLRDLREARDACNKLPFDDARACRCRRRRRHASLHLTALELCAETADGTLWQTEQRPPRRSLLRPVRISPPARAAAAAAAALPGSRAS